MALSPDLGKLVKDYRLSWVRVRQILGVMALSALTASACLLPAIFVANETLGIRIGVAIVGLFVASPVFVGIFQLVRLSGSSLSLYENGLIYRRRGRQFTAAWDEIESVAQEGACRIATKSGAVIEFGPSVEAVGEAAQVIQEQTLQRLLPQARAAVQRGESVRFPGLKPFGPRRRAQALNAFAFASSGFSVDAQGITEIDTGKRIAWPEVQAFGVGQERMGRASVDVFRVEGSHDRFRTRLGLLSNAHVLLALCAGLTGLQPMD